MNWEIQPGNGLWLPQLEWWLDAREPVARSFVSHAHFDHIGAHREILCSEGTAKLMRARLPGERIEHILPFNRTEPLTADTSITLVPAGHIFGSAQALIQHPARGSLLYTGDFKLRPGLSAEACATPPAQTLIMETTFGRPHYVFPPTADVLAAIETFCCNVLQDGEVPVLFGYSLGKSQELLRGFHSAGIPVMLHPATHKLTRVYEELGLVFPAYELFDETTVAGHVVICPPQVPGSSFLKKIKSKRTAVLTGWAMDSGAIFRYQCDAAFPLSDHADYPDLLTFVERVKPERVYTVHGFAADFARTLRARGIEAFALGEANQLDLDMTISVSPPPPVRKRGAPVGGRVAAESFAAFAEAAERIRATASKLEKIEILGAYFGALDSADAARAAIFFTGRAFAQADDRVLNLGWSAVKHAVLAVSGVSEQDLRNAYRRYADSGEAAAAILETHIQSGGLQLAQLAAFLGEVAQVRGSMAKVAAVEAMLRRLGSPEAKYLIKIISGDLRIGLKEGLVEEAVAKASGQPLAAIREANMLSGDLGAVMTAASAGALESIQLRVFHPIQFMLASPEPTAEAILERMPPPIWLEQKYDGIRCQIHKQGDRIELYSRDLHRVTEQFPDLVAAARVMADDFIADGELLAWRDQRALPFSELQKRLGRKAGDDFFLGQEIPVTLSLYDLLWRNGRILLREPLSIRRRQLEELAAAQPAPFILAPVEQASTAVDIEAAFLASRRRGNEGLMAKDPSSSYSPGRRGLAWLKLKKAFATLDVVVVAVEYGHSKRRDVLSDYTFAVRDPDSDRLLTVGKAYSGLTDVEIATLTQHFIATTLSERGRVRTVDPTIVLEVAFDSIQPSHRHQSGFALRFPRINRIRADKTVGDIDTLATCRKLAAPSAFADAAPNH
jgi:DNA ligase-1